MYWVKDFYNSTSKKIMSFPLPKIIVNRNHFSGEDFDPTAGQLICEFQKNKIWATD